MLLVDGAALMVIFNVLGAEHPVFVIVSVTLTEVPGPGVVHVTTI
jgi:hypothetical protein